MGAITDNNSFFLFSDNAKPISVSLDDGDLLTAKCWTGTEWKEFGIPFVGAGELDLRAILSAMPIEQPALKLSANGLFRADSVNQDDGDNFRLYINGQILAVHYAIKGGYCASSMGRFLLTNRPSVNPTFGWCREYLFFRSVIDAFGRDPDDVWINSVRVDVKRWFKSDCDTVTLAERGEDDESFNTVLGVDVSAKKMIRVVGRTKEYPDAYDVQVTLEDSDGNEITFEPIRFVMSRVSKPQFRSFLFRNPIGGFDTVISKGAFRIVPSYSIQAFRHQHAESEMDTGATEHMEVNSGPIGSGALRRAWLDFLHSTEKYMCDQDGQVNRIILDESSPDMDTSSVNDVSFRFHFADDPKGNGMQLTVRASILPDYKDYNEPEADVTEPGSIEINPGVPYIQPEDPIVGPTEEADNDDVTINP